jgi:hypothetical protein
MYTVISLTFSMLWMRYIALKFVPLPSISLVYWNCDMKHVLPSLDICSIQQSDFRVMHTKRTLFGKNLSMDSVSSSKKLFYAMYICLYNVPLNGNFIKLIWVCVFYIEVFLSRYYSTAGVSEMFDVKKIVKRCGRIVKGEGWRNDAVLSITNTIPAFIWRD